MSVGSGGSAGRGPKLAHRGPTSSSTHLDLSSFSQLIQTEKETLNVISEPVAAQGHHVWRRTYIFRQKAASAHSACSRAYPPRRFNCIKCFKITKNNLERERE